MKIAQYSVVSLSGWAGIGYGRLRREPNRRGVNANTDFRI